MGTNYYWKNSIPTPMFTEPHIGKVSGAGYYCYDCDEALTSMGNEFVHSSKSKPLSYCPMCDSPRPDLNELPITLFKKEHYSQERPTGIRLACSFSFAVDPIKVLEQCHRYPSAPIIVDEYGEEMTGSQFIALLTSECPIRFYNSIGTEFS